MQKSGSTMKKLIAAVGPPLIAFLWRNRREIMHWLRQRQAQVSPV